MKTVIEVIFGVGLCVAVIYALFTGNLTTEQLIAMVLSAIMVSGIVNEIREHIGKRKTEEE